MDIFKFVGLILYFIDHYLVPLIFAVAFVVFLWGLYTYFILGGANDEKREDGKKLAFWGIMGFVIMIAVWGIVSLLVNSFGFDTRTRPALPTFGGSQTAPRQGNSVPVFGGSGSGGGSGSATRQPDGGSCSLGSECVSGVCQRGTCVARIPTDGSSGNADGSAVIGCNALGGTSYCQANFGQPYVCDASTGACQRDNDADRQPNGAACGVGADCMSGVCHSGVCEARL